MKYETLILLYCAALLSVFGCSNDSGNGSDDDLSNKVQGTIALIGEETATLGTSLTVGNIEVANEVLSGTDKAVILLSDNISVVDDQFVYDDDQNGFVIVAADFSTGGSPDVDKSISMVIVKNGQEFRHACTSPYQNFFTACGEGFEVDFEAHKAIFQGTTVINTDNDAILTLEGMVTWE